VAVDRLDVDPVDAQVGEVLVGLDRAGR